jgi:hypothetical protein
VPEIKRFVLALRCGLAAYFLSGGSEASRRWGGAFGGSPRGADALLSVIADTVRPQRKVRQSPGSRQHGEDRRLRLHPRPGGCGNRVSGEGLLLSCDRLLFGFSEQVTDPAKQVRGREWL